MKIAILGLRGFPNVPGGVETHCENLFPRISLLGAEVTVISRECYLSPDIREYKGVTLLPVSCPRRKSLETFVHTFRGVLAARRLHPQILHIHAVGPALFVPLARLLGMRVVMTNHGPDYERRKWGPAAKCILRLGEFLGSRFADEIICISPPIARKVREKYGREAHIIPNGIDIPVPERSTETIGRFGLEPNRFVLTVGRFVPEKGFDDLLTAFARAIPDGWKLVIAGDADHETAYSRALRERAREIPGIVLTGYLTGRPLRELYSHAGLFVLPSSHEGLPIVLLEAMSYGLSCLASDIPANRCVGLPEERYFPCGDISALTKKLRRFTVATFPDTERAAQIRLLRENYDWDTIARETWEVYARLVPAEADRGGLSRPKALGWERRVDGAVSAERDSLPLPSLLRIPFAQERGPRFFAEESGCARRG